MTLSTSDMPLGAPASARPASTLAAGRPSPPAGPAGGATGSGDHAEGYTDVATSTTRGQPGAEAQSSGQPLPRLAVLVCHGMGQQVPFETLDLVGRGLHDAAAAAVTPAETPPKLKAEVVRLDLRQGQEMLTRATIRLRGVDGPRDVDLYEAYWAPLTEGKVTTLDVFWFLITAGWNGLTYTWGRRTWRRWMFDGMQSFTLRPMAALPFVGAWLVFLTLVLTNTLIASVGVAAALFGPPGTPGQGAWPSPALISDLTYDLALLLFGGGVPGVAVWWTSRARGGRTTYERPWAVRGALHALLWALVKCGFLITVLVGVLMVVQLLWHATGGATPFFSFMGLPSVALGGASPWGGVVILLWALAFLGAEVARRLLVQYLGDVAAYVSAYSVNKFWEVREAIKQASCRVGRAVYDARRADGSFLYEQVIVVGHSLGSVVAYDTLNKLINEDFASARAGHADEARQVEARTPLLLTFGSPLDKTAFVFTSQITSSAELREAAATSHQPLIASYARRPARWINVWSPDDWISGSLEYYDHPNAAMGNGRRVVNLVDPDASTPLLAHNEYWTNPLMIDTLYRALVAPLLMPRAEVGSGATVQASADEDHAARPAGAVAPMPKS